MSVTENDWELLRARVSSQCASLTDGEFLVVGEPDAPQQPRKGFLRRRPRSEPTRFTQAARRGSWLHAECVGARAFGGAWDISGAAHEQLRALGWLAPGDPDPTDTQPSIEHYWRTVPSTEHELVAQLLVDGLRLLEVAPAAVEVVRDRA